MRDLVQDLRYGLRNLRRNRGFVLVALLTLALGIGANTTIFSVINNTLLKPLPYPGANRLVLVWETFGKGPDNWNIVSAPNFWDFQRQSRSFESMAIFDSAGRGYNLSPVNRSQEAEQVSGLRVSAGFFSVLGVKPLLGRTFLPEEEMLGRDREVVLSYGLWKSRYDGDPLLVGKTIRMDGADFTVIGVMPREFEWQFWSGPRRLWVPVGYTKTDYGRGDNSFISIARLKPGVSVGQAKAEMEAVGKNIAAQYPKEDPDMGATVAPLADFGMTGIRTTMLTLLAAVAFVLLIACVNVANLLLARGAGRQKEFAIRLALGARAPRIARQLLTENGLLALAGGAAGLLVAAASTRLLFYALKLESLDLPLRQIDSLAMDGRVFAFALLLSGLTGLLFGVAPAVAALRTNVNEPLKEGGRTAGTGGHNRLRQVLVASEVALALVVLSGAGLMVKSMTRLLGVDPGLNPRNVLTMGISVPQEEIYVGPPGLPRFCQDIQEHAGAIPGVVSVGAIAHLPFRGNAGRAFQIEGRPAADPGHMPGASYTVACPNYFRTMGIPVLKGREFTFQDTLNAPGAIVINEKMAHDFWPSEDPVGRAIRLGGSNGPRLTVVGVVGDVHYLGLDAPVRRQFFRPYPQAGWPVMTIVVRSIGTPGSYGVPVRKALAGILPDSPVSGIETMEDVVHNSTGSRRLPMLLLSVFSVLALVLAAVGIVGVVGHSVAQRTHEIGIRMALGAGTMDVLRLMVNGSMAWVLVGLVAGVAGSAGLTRLLTGMLYQVRPLDPVVLGGVSLLLLLVALLASYIPARRAARIDPIVALRCE
ncbi:MAG: ABC transporter permease [Candidatus Sulfopaludibacter sp.]|nr:ABC transporter permease [Candidatus Sulfopaludibacter sp.]